jgi:hypothetical protein
MKSNFTFRIILIPAVILSLFLAGCFVILSVNQPATALGGAQITASVTVKVEGMTDANPHYGIAGFLIPDHWSVVSASFSGAYTDNMSYLPPEVADNEPGGQVDFWYPALEEKYPSGEGYKWIVYQSNTSHLTIPNDVEAVLTVVFNSSAVQGTFNLGYFVTDAALDFSDPTYYSVNLNNPILIAGIVPVELTSFTASAANESVTLKWETATETNNRGFEVERSIDNFKFAPVGFVAGKGTTIEKSSYTFVDKSITSENYYYRLKQYDFNGTYSYSDIIEVSNIHPSSFSISQNYPNPFNPATSIKFGLPVDSKVTITVYNSIGEIVSTPIRNSFPAGTHYINIDAVNLTSGTYIYSISAEGSDGSNFLKSNKMILMK